MPGRHNDPDKNPGESGKLLDRVVDLLLYWKPVSQTGAKPVPVDFRGGYTPEIKGRPSSIIEKIREPETLIFHLSRCGIKLEPMVREGDKVETGDILAAGGTKDYAPVKIPAPAGGTVSFDGSAGDQRLILNNVQTGTAAGKYKLSAPEYIQPEDMAALLMQGGLWPFFWSSDTRAMSSWNPGRLPKSIIVNCILTEPFRARGKVILRQFWQDIIQGIKFMPRILADYGTIDIVLTHANDPIARKMYSDLAGFAWVKFHKVPIEYPIENPRLLNSLIRKKSERIARDEAVWIIDIQALQAVGALLASGIPLSRRVIAIGGPGCAHPRHVQARVGTPLKSLIDADPEKNLVLRGGLFNGEPVDIATEGVRPDDDGFFILPRVKDREFLHFIRPGFNKRSIFPAFIASLFRIPDGHVTNSLRGEERPCVACGMCEKVCPVRLYPQVIHRYLYGDMLEEAEKTGINVCVDCRLCTYVCPSKIDLAFEFEQARKKIEEEKSGAGAD
jgi:Na(+)-translocating NADH:ubiquinone oxidoreductase A subunit